MRKIFLLILLGLSLTCFSQANAGVIMMARGADVTPPEFVSCTIAADGETTTIVFSENVTGTENDTFDLDCDGASGADVALTYSSGSGTTSLVFTAGETIQSTETCNLDFDGDADEFEDDAGNDLADFENAEVTNNSAEAGCAPCEDHAGSELYFTGDYDDACGTGDATEQRTACTINGTSTEAGTLTGATVSNEQNHTSGGSLSLKLTNSNNDRLTLINTDSRYFDDAQGSGSLWVKIINDGTDGPVVVFQAVTTTNEDWCCVKVNTDRTVQFHFEGQNLGSESFTSTATVTEDQWVQIFWKWDLDGDFDGGGETVGIKVGAAGSWEYSVETLNAMTADPPDIELGEVDTYGGNDVAYVDDVLIYTTPDFT